VKSFVKFIFPVFLFFSVSCATSQVNPPVDLETKGVIRTDFFVLEPDTREIVRPNKVYFVKLSSAEDFKSEKIYVSERADSDGRIYINLAPGLYAVVAVERVTGTRFGSGYFLSTFFDSDLIGRTVVKLEKGSEQMIKLRLSDYTGSLFDKSPEVPKYYKKIIYKQRTALMYAMLGKFLDSPESIKAKKVEVEKSDEVHAVIEKY
jgi:hypothetical protein